MRVAVIGCSGGMGSLFVSYFLQKGHAVVGSDPTRPRARSKLVFAESNELAVDSADAVLIATPAGTTAEVFNSLVPHAKRGATFVDISSVKGELPRALMKLASGRVSVLSLHPLFGPSLRRWKGMKLAVITDVTSRSVETARRLFPDARLLPMTTEEHDRAMAVLLSLTHLMQLLYAKVAADAIAPRRLRELATPTTQLQLVLAESVLSQDPKLCSHIQFDNGFTLELVDSLLSEVGRIKKMLSEGDRPGFEAIFSRLARLYSAGSSSTERLYGAVSASLLLGRGRTPRRS